MTRLVYYGVSLLLCLIASAGCDGDPNVDEPNSDMEPDAEISDTGPAAPTTDAGTPCRQIGHAYAPFTSMDLQQFPDDVMTRPDTESPTGIRVDHDPDSFPWLQAIPPLVLETVPDLKHLSGFSQIGRIFVSFDAPLFDDINDSNVPDHSAIALLDMTAEPPVQRAFMAEWGPEKTGLFVRPLAPLLPGHQHALIVSREVLDSPSTCLTPSEHLAKLLNGEELPERLNELRSRYEAAVEASEYSTADVVAATVFTTHRDLEQVFEAAAQIHERQFSWGQMPTCQVSMGVRTCQTSFTARDYRDERSIITSRPSQSWELPVTIHAPENQDGPLPVVLYGHGLNSSRGESRILTTVLSDFDYIVVATDALHHGDHPTRTDPENVAALDFLGLYLTELRLDAFDMRGNFNQTILDRLQLLELLRSEPDFDGDGVEDFDPERIVYFGVSLGGMLGSALLSMDATIKAGVFSVAGGQLMGFVTGTETISMFRGALINLFGTEGNFQRMLAVAQSLVDAADPVIHAPQVLARRRTGDDAFMPSVLLPVSTVDDTVPPPTGEALARALGLPHIEPVAVPVLGLDTQPPGVTQNAENGEATIGYFQFDRISRGDSVSLPTHSGTPTSPEAVLQLKRFLKPVLRGEPAVIIDPFEALDTPPLD